MSKNFKVTLSGEGCVHSETCGCPLVVEGISLKTVGFKVEITEGTLTEKYNEAICRVNTYNFDARSTLCLPKVGDEAFFPVSGYTTWDDAADSTNCGESVSLAAAGGIAFRTSASFNSIKESGLQIYEVPLPRIAYFMAAYERDVGRNC